MTRSDLDRALFHADPLPYEDGADEHDHELATLAADRAGEHAPDPDMARGHSNNNTNVKENH